MLDFVSEGGAASTLVGGAFDLDSVWRGAADDSEWCEVYEVNIDVWEMVAQMPPGGAICGSRSCSGLEHLCERRAPPKSTVICSRSLQTVILRSAADRGLNQQVVGLPPR